MTESTVLNVTSPIKPQFLSIGELIVGVIVGVILGVGVMVIIDASIPTGHNEVVVGVGVKVIVGVRVGVGVWVRVGVGVCDASGVGVGVCDGQEVEAAVASFKIPLLGLV